MNQLSAYNKQLPDNIEDLSKFVLVGREKLVSVRAEIRAIDKVEFARDVRDQKKNEAQMLSEALLDAEVRLGDLMKQIPKAQGARTDKSQLRDSGVPKSKEDIVTDLGFSKKQAQRFETLADNKDLVEQVKQEARENDDLPTRTRVIDLAQQRKKKELEEQQKEENFYDYIDECKKVSNKLHEAIYAFIRVDTSRENLIMWKELLRPELIPQYLSEVESDISKLIAIQIFLKGGNK